MMMKINKEVNHINMVVPNVKESVEWYCKALGFTVKGHFSRAGFEIYYIDNGTIMYELFENKGLHAPQIDHIAYTSDDIEADHEYYRAAGFAVSPIGYIDFTWENGADYFFIEGASGEKVELIHIRE